MSSKYKGKNKFRKSPAIKPLKRDVPVFLYTSDCHDAPAEKPPCERSDADREKRQYGHATLGTWKCTVCKKKAKVRRKKNKPEKDEIQEIGA
jgi:hypothetical protein